MNMKKNLSKRIFSLFLAIVMIVGALNISALGNQAEHGYIPSHEGEEYLYDYNYGYSYSYDYDENHDDEEYGYEEAKAKEEAAMPYQQAIKMQPAFLIPTPFSNMVVPGHVSPAHAWSWGDFQDAVANAISGGESYLYMILASGLTADSAITIPAGLTVFLQGNGHSIFQDTAGQRHFI
ncbi:MAG: hypothetical protein FWC69_06270, partial [Defluviitaleaceae bacterium]|nr:hypothetical protein [Defluviitaleaceae bacterium]